MEKVDKGMGILQKLMNLQKKYGFGRILGGLFLMLLTGYTVFFTLNPTYLLDKIEAMRNKQHENAVARRIKSDAEVRLLLERLRMKTDADRAWLIEFHNGSSNLSTGSPFIFGSMRLETTKDTIVGVEEEYADFSLARYSLVNKILEEGYFYGDIETIRPLDRKLYFEMCSNDVNEVAILALFNGNTPLGIIGITYCKNNTMADAKDVGMILRKAGIKIATLLII